MAPVKATGIQKLMGIGLLAAICMLALFVALVVGPAISQSSGIADEIVSFALGGVFFVIAIACWFGSKALAQKKAAEGDKNG